MQYGSDGDDDRTQQHGQPDALLRETTARVMTSFFATDLAGVITSLNRGMEQLLGYQASDLVGRDTGAIFPVEGALSGFGTEHAAKPGCRATEFYELCGLSARTGAWAGVRTLIDKDGRQLEVQLDLTVMLDGSGTPSGFLCTAQQLSALNTPEDRKEAACELLDATIEAMPHPFYLKDSAGVFIKCNDRFAEFLGMNRESILGARAESVAPRHPDSDEFFATEGRGLPAGLRHGQTTPRAGETSAVLLFKEAVLLGSSGVELGVAGSILDITGQTRIEEQLQRQTTILEDRVARHQRAEEALREREKMLSLVINAVPQNIFWKDTKLVFVGCNERFARSAGLSSPAEIVGKTDYDLPWLPEEAESYQRDDRKVMRLDCASYHIQESQHQNDGPQLTLDTTKIPLHDDAGLVVGILGIYEDISKRVSVERELKESEEQLRVIVEASQAGIITVGPDGTVNFANRRMAEMFGVGMSELLGTSYVSWLHPTDKEEGEALAQRLLLGEIAAVSVERHYLRGDGSDFWGYLSGRRLENDDGTLRALVGCIADVTALKSSQSALEREKERLTVTLRSIGDGVITVDTEGRVVLLNRAAEGLCGYRQEEAAGLPLDQVFRVFDERSGVAKQNSIARALASGVVIEESGIGMLVSRDGSERIIVSKTAPILDRNHQIPGVVLVFSDITERREIEEELFKARKLESLGILAGGIAHDFNNLLTGIMGNISLSRAQLPDSHQAATFLERARKGSEQAKELTLQLLTFSKGGAPIKKLTSITQVLRDSAIFALRGSNVRCDFDIAPDLWNTEIDTGQMSQVISNLVINADQAMPDGGTILIRAENVLPLEESDQDRRIRITFKDTGVGISEENVSRIYDPYFSTKTTGSGLGLATVYAIIKNHDGEIRVFSRLTHGTTFAITLPAQEGGALQQAPSEPQMEAFESAEGGGRILLMDDEDAIREMAAAALSMFGYLPEVACDGEEMLELYRQAQEGGEPFDAVIMDLTVPGGMGGKEAVRKLLELDPQALAIASSGYSEDPVMANFRDYGFVGIVSKPYSLQELDDTLKEILARGMN
jgi:PAS domain S-box-containing protein